MTEIWKDIPPYAGKYQVSNLGNIRSINYRNTKQVRMMAPIDNGSGYLFVGLRDGGEKRFFYVHRLVAEAFIPNPDNLPQVNHLDHDRGNNHLDNLEWSSIRDNLLYGTTHKRMAETLRHTSPFRKAVAQYDLDGNLLRIFASQREAERETGICSIGVSMCCTGKNKTAGGYVFKFYPCETKNLIVK